MFFSTETAHLKLTIDILLNLELRNNTRHIGLDISVAFVTIDHDILLSVLDNFLGMGHRVHSFIRSYFCGRS